MMLRDADGRIIVPGRRSSTLSFDASSGSYPSWLTLGTTGNDTGSTAPITVNGSASFVTLTPATTASATATLSTPSVDLTKVAMIRMSMSNVKFSHATNIGLYEGAWDDGALFGGRLSLPATSPYLTLGSFPISSSTNPVPGGTDYNARTDNEYNKGRTLQFYMYPQTRWQYLAEGDSVIAAWRHGRLDNGTVIPRWRAIQPSSGVAARSITFERLELEIAYL